MRAATVSLLFFIVCGTVGLSALAQTTAGTSATIVVPLLAQTGSFASEVSVYNPNGASITINPAFYDAQNTLSPGLKPCTSLVLAAGRSVEFSVASQCALPAVANFGLLLLTEQTGTQRFYGYVRTQTPQGVGFSTEGFPIENFNDQLQHATGLKHKAANGGLPAYQTNCFVTSLGDAISYELRLFDGATNGQLGSTLSGSLQPFQQFRYLDVFAQAGVAAGDRTNVRAEFTNLTAANKKLIGFCTVQENTTFSADFRIAKSYGGTPQNAFVQGGNAFGTTALLGTTDDQPLEIHVGGGRVQRIEAHANAPSFIAGNAANTGNGNGAVTIAGGGTAGPCLFGPCRNEGTGNFATVGGGRGNLAAASATVAGGEQNRATGTLATSSGGFANLASGYSSTVGGGLSNQATGFYSVVPGGSQNVAQGSYSVGLGHDAIAVHASSFVWNGWSSGSAASFRNNAFQVHGESGLDIEYGTRRVDGGGTSWVFIGAGFAGQAIATSTGAFLSTGGQWTNSSDRNRKTALVAVDPSTILHKVSALPITSWQYVDEPPSLRHIGPMAQDFHHAFAVGGDPTAIGTVDADGVALAAIQGLHRLVVDKDAKIEALSARVAQLEVVHEQLLALQTRLQALNSRAVPSTLHAAP